MNEIALSTDLNIITAEINSYKQMAGQAIFEIGRRLKHVKENDLVHGEWSKWCREQVGMDRAKADKFIRVFDEFGRNELTSTQRGLDALYQIATLPPEQREQAHTLANGETKTVDEMTVRELREVKKALKEKEEEAQQLQDELNKLSNQQPKVIEKVVEKVVEDKTKIDSLESRLKSEKQQLEYVIAENDKIKKQLNLAKYTKEQHERLENNIRELTKQRTDLQQDVDDIEEITRFVMKIEEIKKEGLAPIAYSNAIRRQSKDQYVIGKLNDLIFSVEQWCKEMREILEEKSVTILEGEIIE